MAKKSGEDKGDFVVLMRRRSKRKPDWLKPYQDKFAKAQKRAAEETKHLSGSVRVIAMNLLTSQYLKEIDAD